MPEAIADTGPVLHLHEIGCLAALNIFESVLLPDRVAAELETRGIDPLDLERVGIASQTIEVEPAEIESLRFSAPDLQEADLAVLFVAESRKSARIPTLTDDLALRSSLESRGLPVSGSFGILVRAYAEGHFDRRDLVQHVDRLLNHSSLHVGRGFRAFVYSLLQQMP